VNRKRVETTLSDYDKWLGFGNALAMDERCDITMRFGGKMCYCKARCLEIEFTDWGDKDPGLDGCDDPPVIMEDLDN
jgi:hypothetical protein